MNKLHLLCNAHLDPVWLWRRNEGMAEALSTFRVAADFCENYDGFIFNHNEAVLYEWVEEYEPTLFERIKKLVKQGRWVIMGGWYIQPDCVMTSGESLMSQIALGNDYFMKKFGVKPTTAINFDSFGHSKGLVQILLKNGYDSYLFMRPSSFKGDLWWEGCDGSKIRGYCFTESYRSLKGDALNKIKRYVDSQKDVRETGICLWGIGNHGGGPSKIDLEEINEFIKSSDMEIIHSTAEGYFAEADDNDVKVVTTSLVPSNIGCYTSMVRIKQANRRLENKIAITEKIMAYADMLTDFTFDDNELNKAKKALAFCQFHDILPGTSIKPAEDDALNQMGYGEEIADLLYNKAFFKLCEKQKKAKENEIPIMIFNPHPYEIEGEFEAGFLLQNQNWTDGEDTVAAVYDENGIFLPTQNEKPECTIDLDWAKKICFRGKLAPSSVTRFDVKLSVVKKEEISDTSVDYITVENNNNTVRISKKTGLIDLYKVNGKNMLENSGVLEVYNDNEDPWGMKVKSFTEFNDSFRLMSDDEANEFIGYPDEKISNVRVVEDGDVRTKVQAFFSYKRSVAVVEYTLPKTAEYVDVNITMLSNEPNVMIKYRLDTLVEGKPYGDTAYGAEELFNDERESVYHKWCGIKSENNGLYVLNNGIYGGSFTNNTIKLSLLRTPVYSAHPIQERAIAPHNRFTHHIDMGERQVSFRIISGENIPEKAQIYNQKPQVLSFFPAGNGEKQVSAVTVNSSDVLLSSVKKTDKGYKVVLYNSAECEKSAEIEFAALNKKLNLTFGKHEIKILDV